MPKQNCVFPLWAPVDAPDALDLHVACFPLLLLPIIQSTGQTALCDGKRGTPHQ